MVLQAILSRAGRFVGALLLAVFSTAADGSLRAAPAQTGTRSALEFGTGSAHEDYLRALQITGIVPLYPWSIRGFSPREIDRLASADTTGPWRLARSTPSRRLAARPVGIGVTLNSGFPYGSNDGAVWAGRGITATATAGAIFRAGGFSLAVAPVAFVAGNSSFPLMENGRGDAYAFNDPSFPDKVDKPQRFGDAPYRRVDAGASTVRFDSRFVAVGFSTANMWIGPTSEYPFLLGTNAAGFPHLFLGTGEPVNVWIGKAHGRVVWGRLGQSLASPVTGSDRFVSVTESGRVRLTTYASLVLLPRGTRGLEIGATRFFHMPYPTTGIPARFWTYSLSDLYGKGEVYRTAQGEETAENQLASAYIRWVFPNNGLEIYAERGYEDWFYDLRELIQQSDYYRSYSLGLKKSLKRRPGAIDVVTAELINYQMPPSGRDRPNAWSIYAHGVLRQGHTNIGQPLGTEAGIGVGAASMLSWTRYTAAGKTTAVWRRTVRAQNGLFYITGVPDKNATDVIHALGVERTRFGRRADVLMGMDVMNNFNRNFSSDVANVRLRVELGWHSGR